ncbi:hypothetical protein R80B4_03010 [Fibrobacteres bacterium R8-0-B4]
MEEEKLTWAGIMQGFAETRKLIEEMATSTKESISELRAAFKAEAAERQAEYEKRQAEADKRSAKLDAKIAEMSKNIIGISDSNGMFAEELFLNTLSEKKEFAGIHFDEVEGDVGCMHKQPDGQRLKDQFDIVMTNAASVAIIEAKYKARKADVETLAGRKVKNFKILFPEYKGLKIYLGLAALALEDDVVEEARKLGVGLLQQVGDTVEYATDWEVKAY